MDELLKLARAIRTKPHRTTVRSWRWEWSWTCTCGAPGPRFTTFNAAEKDAARHKRNSK
ncbi:hypothetical protein QFW82_20815 [Streptomyces malaysiensis subsp. malaysiensis]|uniref:hypothetical protein n=1 Tax=Streptomyces malaysiensis TaxID=92644 RepID=UPI0024C00600|nr:hypothetical protein [Streptomyces sp. NA07423]WHX19322.1 hypothetical protein QFW82_20815 [Streptomyces sp. NA07423]